MAPVFTAIRYHVWWPSQNDPYYQYNTAGNTARKNYYGFNFVPYFLVDGTYQSGGYETHIFNRSTIESPLAMNITGNYDQPNLEGQFTVHIYAEMDPGLSNLRLRVALVEDEIYWVAPNGTRLHHETFREMYPSTYGEPITISQGQNLEYTYNFTTPSPLVPRNLKLVAFVQSDLNREIVQGARAHVINLGPSSVDDNSTIPEVFGLAQNYPNPFNAETKIDFRTQGGDVKIEVYDLTGSLVKTIIDGSMEAGVHSVIWDGKNSDGNLVSTGVYFYKLSSDYGTSVKKMTMLK
jgi:hypothetical protein